MTSSSEECSFLFSQPCFGAAGALEDDGGLRLDQRELQVLISTLHHRPLSWKSKRAIAFAASGVRPPSSETGKALFELAQSEKCNDAAELSSLLGRSRSPPWYAMGPEVSQY